MPTFLASERWFLLTLSNHQHLKRKVKTIQIDLLNLMFCFSNDDPKETCPLAFIYLLYLFLLFSDETKFERNSLLVYYQMPNKKTFMLKRSI